MRNRPREQFLVDVRRRERVDRIREKQHLRKRGILTTKVLYGHRVEAQIIDVTQGADCHRLNPFSQGPKSLWCKQRGVAKRVAWEDRENGGQPQLSQYEAYRAHSASDGTSVWTRAALHRV